MMLIFHSLLLDGLSILLALFGILYYYVTRNFGYWEKKGVHTILPTPFFGSISNILLLQESPGCWLARKYKAAAGKKFFGAYFVDKPTLILRDLELVKSVLVKDAHTFLDRTITSQEDIDPMIAKNLFGLKGKRWRHIRVKLSPTFTSGKMKKMFYLVDECGKQLAKCLEKDASTGASVIVKETMARYSTDVIASCAFGFTPNAQVQPNCEFRTVLRTMFERDSLIDRFACSLFMILPSLMKTFKLKAVPTDVDNFVRKMFWDVVEERKKTGILRNDFMDLMIKLMNEGEVRGEDVNDLEEIRQDASYSNFEFSKTDNVNSEMKDDDFVAQAFAFLVAGFETSSAVLSYALYEFALNTRVQEKLRKEINTSLDKHGGKLTYKVVSEMTYLDAVVSETLRKYPTIAFIGRECLSDYKISGSEVTIEKGTSVMIPILGIHSDPEYYPDPEKYEPERFAPENRSKIPQYAHLPFGEGPRICIGMRFGQMQVKTALIYIIKSYQVLQCAETPAAPLMYKPGALTHAPAKDIVVAFRKL